ncbi:hypothetical protein [Azospirillum palustre]|uniref:hypothetical protein n=1 Tax=Azospirillum palustre TaxID=2044885 RepID=UPI001178BBAF|nr:hypothetical protein [Azospirillum palustre]
MTNYDLYGHLIETARKRRVLSYRDVAAPMGLDMDSPKDRDELSKILYEISVSEYNQGRPLLSVLVIGGEKGIPSKIPGSGFYEMASDLGFNISEKLMFFVEELNRVHEFWSEKK